MASPRHYSTPQIALHWTIALLVGVQFITAGPMEEAWRAWKKGGEAVAGEAGGGTVHAVLGLTILVLAIVRLGIRLTRGAPPVPESHPAVLRVLAHLTHFALYAFLFLMPVSGAAAWFGGVDAAAFAHVIAKNFLLAFVALHVLGAFAELAVFHSGAFQRMLGVEPGR